MGRKEDYEIPPENRLDDLVEKIRNKIQEHKKLVGEDSALVVEVLEDLLK